MESKLALTLTNDASVFHFRTPQRPSASILDEARPSVLHTMDLFIMLDSC
jgi:hypothetical protein